jgi:hypothetical protein
MLHSSTLRSAQVGAVIAMACLFAGIATPGAALAANGQIKLVLRPLDQKGAYFDLTMKPGETRTMAVEIGNAGREAVAARTYAANVQTIINGGFGASLRDDAQSGVTRWLDYSTTVLQLPAAQAIHRTFVISVPPAAGPGEYITSLVVENDQAVSGAGTFALNQFVRQAIAVVVTVPGQRSPALAIAGASHIVVAGKSVVAIAIENPGNVRLRPVATFTLRDAAGAQVSQASLPMETFYSATSSAIEVPLAALLQPGTYTVDVVLEDALQNVRVEATRTFVVEAPAKPIADGGAAPALIGVNQQPIGAEPQVPWLLVGVSGLTLAAAAVALFALVRRRRRGSA